MSDNIEIGISLDNVEALTKTLDLSKAIDSLGESVGVQNLALQFGKLNIAVSVVKKAIDLVNKAIDFAVAGENIKQIETTFSNLAGTMGVSASQMIEGMQKVTKNTMDETDAMKLASSAMIQLGQNSNKIPEIFAVAKNAAKLFGGTAEEQFDKITNAITRQSTRQLHGIGIHVDAAKAMREYGNSIGVAADYLTEAQKRTALLNETLRQGASNMEASGKAAKPIQEAYKQMNVAIQDLKETFEKLTSTLISDKVAGYFSSKAEAIRGFKTSVVATIGEGAEAINAKIAVSQKELSYLQNQEKIITDRISSSIGTVKLAQEEALVGVKNRIDQVKISLEDLQKTSRLTQRIEYDASASDREKAAAAQKKVADQEEADQLRQKQLAFVNYEASRISAAQASMEARLQIETNLDQTEAILMQQKGVRVQQHNAFVKQIELSTALTEDQKNEMIRKSAEKLNADLIKLERDKDSVTSTILKNQTKGNQDFFTNLKASAKQAYGEIVLENQNAASTIKNMMTDGLKGLGGAFTMLGEIAGNAMSGMAMSAEEAAKKMLGYMLGMIGDIAIQFGTLLVLQAFEFPWKAAIGAALLTFGGVMKGLSGGLSKTSSSAPSGVGGSGGSPTSYPKASSSQSEEDKRQREQDRLQSIEDKKREREEDKRIKEEERLAAAAEKDRLMAAREMEKYQSQNNKQVTIQIQGHYFETEQTKTRLMDIVRQASDSQDFNLIAVGS